MAVDEAADGLEELLRLLELDELAGVVEDDKFRSGDAGCDFFGQGQGGAEVVGSAGDQGRGADLAEPVVGVVRGDHVDALELDLPVSRAAGVGGGSFDPLADLIGVVVGEAGPSRNSE